MAKKYQLIHVGFGTFPDPETGEVRSFASAFVVDTRKIAFHSDNDRSESGFKVHKLNLVKDDGSFEPNFDLAKKLFEFRQTDSISLSMEISVDVDIDLSTKTPKTCICDFFPPSVPKK